MTRRMFFSIFSGLAASFLVKPRQFGIDMALSRDQTSLQVMREVGAMSLKMAQDFQASFVRFRKTQNETSLEFQQLAQEFRDLAKTIPVDELHVHRSHTVVSALKAP